MYNLIKSVIANGGYKLADIQYKAKKLYLMGDITEEQLDEIMRLAADGVNSDAERPGVVEMLTNLSARIEVIEAHLFGDAEPDTEGYEAWMPWDGLSDKYQYGAIVAHDGKLWISEYTGQNVWKPGTLGTESMWIEYEE